MTQLFHENLRQIRNLGTAVVPDEAIFKLPERVLQFGTGAFLRGLSDYCIDKANRQGIFNGRIVVVKSTEEGDIKSFDRQNNLYTICTRGFNEGKFIKENIICSSISRVLSAKTQWSLVLDIAKNPSISVVISNTTELGIQLVQDDIYQWPPVSYPGKLLAFLYARYVAFGGNPDYGLVIVPTELISENGNRLESIVLELAHRNGLESNFIDWIEQSNSFCNSLVDRIVPGKPQENVRVDIEEELGYHDALLITAEHYHLWAIEGDEVVRKKLSFAEADEQVIIQKDIELYKELKLRLLNGSHTLGSGLAHLCGFRTVAEAMQNTFFATYLDNLIENEIAPSIPYPIDLQVAQNFGKQVMDRFRNPHIEHQWLNITSNFSAKILSRVMPVFHQYQNQFQTNPEYITFGFAAYIYFMKSVRRNGEQHFGQVNGQPYLIKDPKAAYFHQKWQMTSLKEMVHSILKDASLWGKDLTKTGISEENIVLYLNSIKNAGATTALKIFLENMEYA